MPLGWNHLALMKDFVLDLSNGLIDPRGKAAKVDDIKKFLNYDFRWKHLTDSSPVITHCMNHALASPHACLRNECDHDHENSCTECNMWAVLMDSVKLEVEAHYSKAIDALLCSADDSAVEVSNSLAELERRQLYLKQLDNEYHRYVAHIVRKHRSSRAQIRFTSQLSQHMAFLWIDYKAKPLSRKNKEGQSESFGKKGLSLFLCLGCLPCF